VSFWPEDAETAWKTRFGDGSPAAACEIESFLLHRSVRDYEDRPVPEELVKALIGAAQSAATSSNLQMWSVISVQDPERRERIAQLCANQDHVRNAAWYFAFIADHRRLAEAAHRVGEPADGLSYMEYLVMALVDVSLAAERFVCAAESVGLGICYIGGLRNHPDGVKQLLGLPDGTFGVFGLCLGWPKQPLAAHVKPRLATDSVWFKEQYPEQTKTEEFDLRMRNFYESENMRGSGTWSVRSGKRVDRRHLTGREVLKPWLEAQGFALE
jgi:nitroreductase